MNLRQKLTQVAEHTLEILKTGYYRLPDGKEVDFSVQQEECIRQTHLIRPEMELTHSRSKAYDTKFIVKNQTTLQACVENLDCDRLICLNFASAKYPGGGFLEGSPAQEESLARASALYPAILQMTEMYESNKVYNSSLYLDYMIYSPMVPVFKDDDHQLLTKPYVVSMITAPAPNKGAIEYHEPHNLTKIEETLRKRIRRVLKLALHFNHKNIILGAWGCGAFKNDPELVAGLFKDELLAGGEFEGLFEKVIFGVLDTRDGRIFEAFRKKLAP